MLKITILSLLLLGSCSDNKQLSQDACEDLSLKCYKGFPSECNKLKKQCSSVKLKYTKELCQSAFNGMILGTSEADLIKEYGPKVTECFTKSDLEKHLRK